MSIIKNIPNYYPLLIGLIKSQWKNYKILDVDIFKIGQHEDIAVLVSSKDINNIATYTSYTASFDYKAKKELNPNSHILRRSIILAAAKDIEEYK